MSTIIRKVVGETSENYLNLCSKWDLRTQVEAVERWLKHHRTELDPSARWIADIGFTSRRNACGGGPPQTGDLMRMCLEVNMEIWLSEYDMTGNDDETQTTASKS